MLITRPPDHVKRQAELEMLYHMEHRVYELSRRKLNAYTRAIWPQLEPGRQLIWNWHLDAICDHLEAVTMGHIVKLMINIPYRMMKSVIVDVSWPSWIWCTDIVGHLAGPHVRLLTGSHGSNLAIRDAVKSRRVIDSPWYQAGYGHIFQLTSDQNEKTRYENDRTGYRITFGMKSGVTGEGGDVLIVDDPHSATEGMFSPAERERAKDTWDQQVANRLNDPERSARVVVMQRLHVDDLAGHVLKEGGWDHLIMPMEYEPKAISYTKLGKFDPRREQGELLFPARFSREYVNGERRRLGSYGYAAQMAQRPVPMGGQLIPLERCPRYKFDQLPRFKRIVQFWDTASKEKELNDPWAGGTLGQTAQDHVYLLDVLQKRMTYPTGKAQVIAYHGRWRPMCVVIEDKSSGMALVQELEQKAIPVVGFEPEGDKVMRMSVESPAIEAGLLFLPEQASWLKTFEDECLHFPDGPTKDQVDMLSMALRWFRENTPRLPDDLDFDSGSERREVHGQYNRV